MKREPRVDAYIASRAEFARPILSHLRERIHAACPEVEEGIKWSMPAFSYKGRPLCNMAAFKEHATFGFWRGKDVIEAEGRKDGAMGQFGRITSLGDLPDDAELDAIIRKAMEVSQTAPPRKVVKPKPPAEPPEDLVAALNAEPKAAETFAAFSPSCRREYVEWVVDAKREETRARRIAQAVEWIAMGKKRNWKYEGC